MILMLLKVLLYAMHHAEGIISFQQGPELGTMTSISTLLCVWEETENWKGNLSKVMQLVFEIWL